MNEREKCQLCVNVCRQVCGVEAVFKVSTLNPPTILHEGHTWTLNQFLNMNWIAWAMRFMPNQTADALTALAADDDNLHLDAMTEAEIQFEWFCAMHEMVC